MAVAAINGNGALNTLKVEKAEKVEKTEKVEKNAKQRPAIWQNIDDSKWNDWKWQMANRITNSKQLTDIFNLSVDEQRGIDMCLERFRMAITPYYASLIDMSNPDDPVRKQCIPSKKELLVSEGELNDPLAEQHYSPVSNIVHRYPDRVLFLLTDKCAMYCRHCTRRRLVGKKDCNITEEAIENALAYIRSNPVIRDVLLSGGDPLMLPDGKLEHIISKIREIPHVEVVRIGTRVPVVLPMRVTDELLQMLKKYHPIWINTHFNHPNEITEASRAACEKIVDAGIPLGNQNVLLKGVNDDADILKELYTKLVKMRVRPYYMYQCDVAEGIGHFRTPVEKGIEIMRNIRGYISGFAVPTFVIDAPMGGGKIPINPEYLVSINDEQVIMRNYKGDFYTYPNGKRE
ncbi:MAG: lysine 2,3-aminomutase [Eubacteriales bacterium]|nr:lysine 2,3-aminomutase [Eubacteriales bacterium]